MRKEEINIRDPFIVYEDGVYYLYGTRAKGLGCKVGGIDVYISDDMTEWSDPIECFDSEKYGLNREANWAPEVYKYKGRFYMFATFTQENGLRGTYSLRSDSPRGPFVPHSKGALTPKEWECLDGTLYIDEEGVPFLVFCHEHTQLIDGTICYVRLNEELDSPVGDAVTMFSASSYEPVDAQPNGHYITDGPFMYRSMTGELFMLWSSYIKGVYSQFAIRFKNKKLGLDFEHVKPLLLNDCGHGMIFSDDKNTYLVYHTPNENLLERPGFSLFLDNGDSIAVKE